VVADVFADSLAKEADSLLVPIVWLRTVQPRPLAFTAPVPYGSPARAFCRVQSFTPDADGRVTPLRISSPALPRSVAGKADFVTGSRRMWQ